MTPAVRAEAAMAPPRPLRPRRPRDEVGERYACVLMENAVEIAHADEWGRSPAAQTCRRPSDPESDVTP